MTVLFTFFLYLLVIPPPLALQVLNADVIGKRNLEERRSNAYLALRNYDVRLL